MAAVAGKDTGMTFLEMQGAIGITKHIGGFAATDELLALCHIEQARQVLNAGCGIGVGPVYMAQKFNCQVVGVDISEKMITWASRRAREAGVEDRVHFRPGDVMALPFEDNRFDLVICESVLVFVEDPLRAIREFGRVTRPGGTVGINEAIWFEPPPPVMAERVKHALGPACLTLADWQAIWDASGLQERVVRPHRVDARTEIRDRIEWIGWPWLLRAWGRALRLIIQNPAGRRSIKEMFDVPKEIYPLIGYGLFAGQKKEDI